MLLQGFHKIIISVSSVFCRFCVCMYVSLLCIFELFLTIHGKLYFEEENEETIRRRCRPELSCFPSQLDWAELEDSLTGRLVWPGDSYNYTAFSYQFNLRTQT